MDFELPGTDGKSWTLTDCRGEQATLVMFICNHCPYVQGILERLLTTARALREQGIKSVAIMPNDAENYPEDGLENMTRLAERMDFPFPYLIDETQQVARSYQAVCTPDFFGYNAELKLQYRGALDEYGGKPAPAGARQLLFDAMRQIADTGQGAGRAGVEHGLLHQVAPLSCLDGRVPRGLTETRRLFKASAGAPAHDQGRAAKRLWPPAASAQAGAAGRVLRRR